MPAPTCAGLSCGVAVGAEGGSRGLCLRRRKVAASPPHKLFRLHFLDCDLTSSRLDRFHLLE
ncbi:MAG: hypothetical protein FWH20_03385 [Oscillospiraceae bacterium]|nr:hypothetical protein [Oscillospiraceae bacterium]